uniref:Uncharacterized protein n=1 Tax=Ixodes ricinus TaxID=34613 RepID=A0A6B0U636_IXORI
MVCFVWGICVFWGSFCGVSYEDWVFHFLSFTAFNWAQGGCRCESRHAELLSCLTFLLLFLSHSFMGVLTYLCLLVSTT